MHYHSIQLADRTRKHFKVPAWGDRGYNRAVCSHQVKVKLDCPQVDSFVNYKVELSYADFDRLPSDYSNWDEFHGHMQHLFGKKAFVFRSFSGKVKVAFLLNGCRNSLKVKIASMKKVLGRIEFDISHSAVNTTFLRPEQFDAMADFINRGVCIDKVFDHDIRVPLLPDATVRSLGLNNIEAKVLALFRAFNKDTVDMPVNYAGAVLGLHPTQVTRALKKLGVLNILKMVDGTTKKGEKGRTFSSVSPLGGLISLKAEWYSKTLVTRIEDGSYYQTLWAATNFFVDLAGYLEWALTAGDLHRPGKRRLKMAHKAWENHLALG